MSYRVMSGVTIRSETAGEVYAISKLWGYRNKTSGLTAYYLLRNGFGSVVAITLVLHFSSHSSARCFKSKSRFSGV
jgi:hypothetical protein